MTTEEAKVEAVKAKVEKEKVVEAKELTVDPATVKMINRSRELNVETIFDRAQTMKACNIGIQGTCCKNCAQGPCRLPLPKSGIEGEDTRKGLCGATAETIAARNFARMVAAGAAAHSDHGRGVAETFLAAARKETHDYKIKDTKKLLEIAPDYRGGYHGPGRRTGRPWIGILMRSRLRWERRPWPSGGSRQARSCTLKRAPKPRYELWKKLGVLPRGIDREIVEIMHRTHMGVDQDYENMVEQCTRAALADGWGGSMMATDLQDVLFGCPYPIKSSANLGVLKEDHVNIIIHGHEPLLSEMIVAAAELPEMIALCQREGRQGDSARRHLLHGQ